MNILYYIYSLYMYIYIYIHYIYVYIYIYMYIFIIYMYIYLVLYRIDISYNHYISTNQTSTHFGRRFREELLKKIQAMADSKNCSAAQLSLAWRLGCRRMRRGWGCWGVEAEKAMMFMDLYDLIVVCVLYDIYGGDWNMTGLFSHINWEWNNHPN